ncbi:cellobiohydrolaseI [Paraphaeosphaeria sporulosa]|uniref:Glucanase n=1 Tax=Paraphaeosphaeria sporulosa TaxID=1460663 RepID=A0A177BZH0_9PLEO|nr:cellobiohydrolaseI [Paraphaeosphaeria sporulosa]OAF99749.1 cellobiohydrolaseI [Paraphaeosphaeria sporulosa]
MPISPLRFCTFVATVAYAQRIGTYEPEIHPKFPITSCAPGGASCTTLNTSLVMDAEWRWIHKDNTYTNCYSDGSWNTTICPDGATCAENCALDGALYQGVYGVTVKNRNLTLQWKTYFGFAQNVGSRLFVLDEGVEDRYKMWKLLNREIAFDVDVSELPCGMSGNLYLVGMDEDGGMERYKRNRAGARYGTGYCDANCSQNLRFISGEANVEDWQPNPIDNLYAGKGKYGSCCPEVDIWEANSVSNALTAHPCFAPNQSRCWGPACDAMCDVDGCDFNSYRLGNTSFYGPGKIIDTTKKFTVITQFLTHNDSDTGDLVAIRRKYIQNGVNFSETIGQIPSVDPFSGITDSFCRQQKAAFGEQDTFTKRGGIAAISTAMERGMVLVFAITEDQDRHMLWLDSNWPVDAKSTAPGVARGSCATDSGDPQGLLHTQGRASFGNIVVAGIGRAEAAL